MRILWAVFVNKSSLTTNAYCLALLHSDLDDHYYSPLALFSYNPVIKWVVKLKESTINKRRWVDLHIILEFQFDSTKVLTPQWGQRLFVVILIGIRFHEILYFLNDLTNHTMKVRKKKTSATLYNNIMEPRFFYDNYLSPEHTYFFRVSCPPCNWLRKGLKNLP